MKEEELKQRLHERISLLMSRYKSQNDMARSIGVPAGTMSAYITQLRGYAVPMAIASNCPEISLEWLFRGEGAMLLADQVAEPEHPEPELPRPGADPAIIKILLDRIEQQAVTIAKLTTENQQYRAALGID